MFSSVLKYCSLYLPYPALGLVISVFLTYMAILVLGNLGFIDIPRGRHQHDKPIPRGGGIAIAAAFFISVLLFASAVQERAGVYAETVAFLKNFSIPAAIILVVGILDDRYELKSIVKLLAQILVGVLIYFQEGGISHFFSYPLPMVVSLGGTVLWCVVIINAFNLIDGLDGVAAGLAAISSALLAVWTILTGISEAMAVILLIFSAGCLGFLRFNFSPARIFMGDTGSTFIGLFFAYVSMQYSTKSVTMTALLVPLAAIGVPVFDVFLAVWRRFFRKYINKDPNSNIMQGDHDHLHHRILKETGATRKTAYVIYCISLSFSLLAMLGVFFENHFPALIFILLLTTFFVMIRYSGIELYDTLTCVARGLKMPQRNFFFTTIHPIIDAVSVTIAFYIARYLHKDMLAGHLPETLWFLTHIGPFILVLCTCGIYRTFWLRAGVIQHYRMLRALALAGVAGYIINCAIGAWKIKASETMLGEYSRFYAVFMLLVFAFVLLERFMVHFYESFGYRRLFIRNQGQDDSLKKVIIYGGGLFCRLYIHKQFCGFGSQQDNIKIVGILDDNPALRNLNVYGFDVLGSLYELEDIFRKVPFDSVVISCTDIEEEKLDCLKKFCAEKNIKLSMFVCAEESVQ